MKKSYAKADVKQNRLYIKIARKIHKQDLNSLYTDIRFSVADLSPGFNVITDLSECTIASLNGVSTFRKISNFLIENRVGTVVRIMNDKSILFRQFVNFSARSQGYMPIIVSTLNEAESQIEATAERSGSRFRLHQQTAEFHGTSAHGTGLIVDISTSGCAIKTEAASPKVGDEISVIISFSSSEDLISDFKVDAKVIKVDDDWFAVQYTSLDEELKEQLWHRLVYESKSDFRL